MTSGRPTILVLLCLASLLLTTTSQAGPPPSNAASILNTVDSAGNVGDGLSLRLNANGVPVISYYDASNESLKMATCTETSTGYDHVDRELDGKMLMGVTSLAKAMDVDAVTIRRWSKNGEMPGPMKVGGRSLWDAHAIRAWIIDGCPRVGA